MTAVLIECLIKRIGGSIVDLPGETYHFKPASGLFHEPHVALVTDRDHMACFLRVPEAYALADAMAEPVAPIAPALPVIDEFATLSDGAIADQFTQAYGSKPPKGFGRDLMITALRSAPHHAHPVKHAKAKAAKAAPVADALDPNGTPATGTAPVAATDTGSGFDAMTDEDVLSEYVAVFGADPAPDMDRDLMIAALKAVPKE